MIWRMGTACLMVLFVWACYTPAYEIALSQAEKQISSACVQRGKLELWTTGGNFYIVSARCTIFQVRRLEGKTVKSYDNKWITYLCHEQNCKMLPELDDWAERVPTALASVPPSSPALARTEGVTAPAVSDVAGNAIEAEVRSQIDASRAAILACTNGEATVVQVEVLPDRTTISLTSKQSATPAEACVRAALSNLQVPGREPLTVRHPVIAK